MNKIRCPQCNLADWANVAVCKRCKFEFQTVVEESEVFPEEEVLESPYQREGSEQVRQEMFDEPADEFGVSEEPNQESELPEAPPLPEERFNQGYEENHQNYQQPDYQPRYSYSNNKPKPKIAMAVMSMIFGIIGMPFVSMFWGIFLAVALALIFGMPGAIVGGVIVLLLIPSGLILGIVSLVKSSRRPSEYGGKGFAIAGIVCSSLGILMLPMIAAIAVPNLLAARRAANEGSAIASIRVLSEGQVFYREKRSGHCGDLTELKNTNLIDDELATSQKNGYQFLVLKLPVEGGGCEITATPLSTFDGNRSFYYSTEDNIMRAENKNGEIADKNAPPLEIDFERGPPKIASSDDMRR